MDADTHLDIRSAIEQLEASLAHAVLAEPSTLDERRHHQLRYVLSFAKLSVVRAADGTDVDVAGRLAPHRWRVAEALRPYLGEGVDLQSAALALPRLVEATLDERAALLEQGTLDEASLEAEVCERQLVIVAGGGGGSGYGYPGAFTLLNRHGLQPRLLSGTSMGALLGVFRARTEVFDLAPMVAAADSLSWGKVFRVLDLDSRYGLPATLRLYLRAAIGHLFKRPDGSDMTIDDLEIPMLIVVTGITVDGLKHDLDYYEHFMDGFAGPSRVFRRSRLARIGRVAGIFKEMVGTPDALREIVFGADEATRQADVVDAVGFSSAIPGLIHYDIYREDERMRRLLDNLYGQTGITRLLEGGVVNNLPCRPAYAEVMRGRLTRRNPFVLALDCFAPSARSPIFLPVQQIIRPNVVRNHAFAHHVFDLKRRLNPLNMVPSMKDITKAMNWTMDELSPDMGFVSAMCAPIAPLSVSES